MNSGPGQQAIYCHIQISGWKYRCHKDTFAASVFHALDYVCESFEPRLRRKWLDQRTMRIALYVLDPSLVLRY